MNLFPCDPWAGHDTMNGSKLYADIPRRVRVQSWADNMSQKLTRRGIGTNEDVAAENLERGNND